MAGTRAIRIAASTECARGILFALVLAAALCLSFRPILGGSPPWQVEHSVGRVQVQSSLDPDERWSALGPGDAVGPLHRIRTDRGGAAVLSRPGNRIQVKGNIDLEFPDPDDGDGAKLYQRTGSATYTISGGRPVSIVTPFLVATTRWGTVTVTVKGQGTTVQVHYGKQTISSRFTRSTLVLAKDHQVRVDAETGVLSPADARPIITETALNRTTP